jgi:hypothetical protein
MTEILDRTAYQRPGSFSEVSSRRRPRANSPPLPSSAFPHEESSRKVGAIFKSLFHLATLA